MKDIYFLLQKKFLFLETPFPLINDGIILLANIGSKNDLLNNSCLKFLNKSLIQILDKG